MSQPTGLMPNGNRKALPVIRQPTFGGAMGVSDAVNRLNSFPFFTPARRPWARAFRRADSLGALGAPRNNHFHEEMDPWGAEFSLNFCLNVDFHLGFKANIDIQKFAKLM